MFNKITNNPLSFLNRTNQAEKQGIQEINRRMEENKTKTLFSAFSGPSNSSKGLDSFFDSFTSSINEYLDINLQEITDTANRQEDPSSSRATTRTLPQINTVEKEINLKFGKIRINRYNQDYDINQSGEIGNKDNYDDNIDISQSQHDYDYDNDGQVDGNQQQINALVTEMKKNRYFEIAEENIFGKLGLKADNMEVDVYFSDRLYPNENKDGVRAITVSTEDPKIIFDLDEIITKGAGLDQRVITHEMTHAAMYQILGNDHQATWFLEGAAVYTAGQGLEKINGAFASGGLNFRGLENLNDSVYDLSGYAESFLAFDYIEKFYGEEGVQDFVNNTLQLESVEKGVEQTFGITLTEFSSRARQYAEYYAKGSSFSTYA